MGDTRAARLGPFVWLALSIAVGTVLLADASRYLPPPGEKFVDFLEPGGADLIPSFNAASALLSGQNPYHYDLRKLPDPYAWSRGSEKITYLYPPSHILLYVPLVWIAGHDFRAAARIHVFLSLMLLPVIALAIIDLLGSIVLLPRELRFGLGLLLILLLGLNQGNQLGLERGQSDVITAAICWIAVVAFRREHYGAAAFLLVAGVLFKGYGLLLAVGLLLLALESRAWRSTVLGVLLALCVLLVPVARYLPDALVAYPIRAGMFWTAWNNQSFYNLVYTLRPDLATVGHRALSVFAIAVAVLSWLQLRRLRRARAGPEQQTLWLGMFAFAALAANVAYSRNSLAYNAVISLPGALLLSLSQPRIASILSARLEAGIGIWFAFATFGLFAFSLPRVLGKTASYEIPTHALAITSLLLLVAACSLRGLTRSVVQRP